MNIFLWEREKTLGNTLVSTATCLPFQNLQGVVRSVSAHQCETVPHPHLVVPHSPSQRGNKAMTEAKESSIDIHTTLWSNQMTIKYPLTSKELFETCLNTGLWFITYCLLKIPTKTYFTTERIVFTSASKVYLLLTPTALNRSFQVRNIPNSGPPNASQTLSVSEK